MVSHPLARDELVHVLTAHSGWATNAGAADGSTIIDANLIGSNDYFTGKSILIMSGPALFEICMATAFNTATGQITVALPHFSAQITAGVLYRVVNFASLTSFMVLFNRTQGLVFMGTVTTWTNVNNFAATDLTGFGNSAFINWGVFVFWDAGGAGAAPQGEVQQITGYTSATGAFVHGAFSAALAVGDRVLILHPWLFNALLAATSGTYNHPNGVAEQTAFTITPAGPRKVATVYLDMVNLTQNCTIRIKVRVDGVTYRTIETFNWTTGMDDGVFFREVAIDNASNLQVTIQSVVAEGAARNIPYRYLLED